MEGVGLVDGKAHIVLTFVTPNDGSSTRSATNDPDGYEEGIGYEDYIDITANDYKIYFFTYSQDDSNGGTIIAEFTPTEVTSSSTSSTTTYTVMGDVPNTLKEVSDFRVVILANWGSYPEMAIGSTTIDALVEGANTTYSADNKFTIDTDNLIPFYGVQEYTGITFSSNSLTRLSTPVSLLRAVAKVEVVLTADSEVTAFSNISIVNYNSQGYCAPAGVYLAGDYDTEAKNNPSTSEWPDEWVTTLHLVNGTNDSDSKTQAFTHISSYDASSGILDTWRIYLPEYDNTSTDYSYISVTINGEPYEIYFAEYDEDGFTDNSDTSNRHNLKRNNLYRFYVTYKYNHLSVWVEKWNDKFDNTFNFDNN